MGAIECNVITLGTVSTAIGTRNPEKTLTQKCKVYVCMYFDCRAESPYTYMSEQAGTIAGQAKVSGATYHRMTANFSYCKLCSSHMTSVSVSNMLIRWGAIYVSVETQIHVRHKPKSIRPYTR